MKFIHTADIHLDSPLRRLEEYEGAPVEKIRQASRRSFENLIDLAIDESVDFVLIAGDVFDGDWKDYNTGLYFVSQVKRLQTKNIPVFIVSGNHDAAGKMTRRLPYPANVHLFAHAEAETRILENLKVAVHGRSFPTVSVSENLVPGYPEPIAGYFNIGLLHTSLTGREGHETYAPCSLDDLVNKGFDYWALGHVHQFEKVFEEPPVVFPGCIQGRHIKEFGKKGCVRVTVEEERPAVISLHAVDVLRWERFQIDLQAVSNYDEILQQVIAVVADKLEQNNGKSIAARVVFTGETSMHTRIAADPEFLKESVRSMAISHFGDRVWIEKVDIETTSSFGFVSDPGPLKELKLIVDQLVSNDVDLVDLGKELSSLFQKLPPEYRLGESALQLNDPDRMKALVAQAHALLAHRLKKER